MGKRGNITGEAIEGIEVPFTVAATPFGIKILVYQYILKLAPDKGCITSKFILLYFYINICYFLLFLVFGNETDLS